jgi:hypothetical protein
MSASARTCLYPRLYFIGVPRDATGTELYPQGELIGSFESRDVCEAVGDTVDRFQFLLRYELPWHCESLVKGSLQAPVKPWAREKYP